MSFTTDTKFLHLISAQNIINFRLGCNTIGCTNIRKKDSDISSQRIAPDTQGKKQICKLWFDKFLLRTTVAKKIQTFSYVQIISKRIIFYKIYR